MDFSCILKELNTGYDLPLFLLVERFLKQKHPLCFIDIRRIDEYSSVDMVPFSVSLSLPLPLKYDKLLESNAEAFLSSFCTSTVNRLLIQHNGELLALQSSLPLDKDPKSWRFLLPRQKTMDSDGLCTIEVDFDLFLFDGEKVEGLKQHLTEICYRVCKQTLLFSRNSGCALSFDVVLKLKHSQLHSHWKNHILFVDEENSTLRFFHYDPNALPFYKQLFIAILIPFIIYLYGLFSAWSRRS